MSHLKINDLDIYYEKSGRKGRPVLLLHGWGQNSSMMSYMAQFLSGHFKVYNIDFPGFGQSDEPKDAWGIGEYTGFLKKFTDHFKISDPIIIGHSFGCRVALMYAYRYPVHKMVLTGAAGIRPKRGFDYYMRVYTYKLGKKLLSINGLERYKEKFMKNAGSEDYKNTSGVMRQTFVKVVNEDLEPLLKDIKTPTLLVWGEKDEAVPLETGRQMEKELTNGVLVVFEGDDHFAYYHQADRFNRVLDAYLKEDY
jgi:pimeloyl-ACP methyl ester carboxylesterase